MNHHSGSSYSRRVCIVVCLILLAALGLMGGSRAQADEGVWWPLSALGADGSSITVWNPGHSQAAALSQGAQLASIETEVVALVNQERANYGLPPLTLNSALTSAALGHSQDMSTNNFFSHTGSDGSSFSQRIARAGYTGMTYGGENIAAGYDSPAAVMNAWMNSSGHRANILSPNYRDIGIGYVYEPNDAYPSTYGYQYYWTQDFANSSSSATATSAATWTRTPTRTPTRTATALPTSTATSVAVATLTPTQTRTPTRTTTTPPTATTTSAAAATLTPTPTRTSTRTPTLSVPATATRTPTAAPTDAAAIIQGSVSLEGRANRPAECWRAALMVSLYQQGTLIAGPALITTDENGDFVLPLVAPGVYDIRAKNLHTLANVNYGVQVRSGVNTISMGTLLEGDASDDNMVDILDFSLMRAAFGSASSRADFNQDGVVDVVDFSLLRAHFGLSGDITVP